MATSGSFASSFERLTVRTVDRESSRVGAVHVHREVEYSVLLPPDFDGKLWRANEIAHNDVNRSVLLFTPMGASSEMLGCWHDVVGYEQAKHGSRLRNTKLISVNKPSIGSTTPAFVNLPHSSHLDPQQLVDAVCEGSDVLSNENMFRLAEHLDDVMKVLEVEGVRRVNVVSMCLGTPSVSAFCVRLLLAEKRQDEGFPRLLLPVSLTGPWVCTECPHSMGWARFGNQVHPFLKNIGIGVATTFMSSMLGSVSSMPTSVQPYMQKQQLSEEERLPFEETDYERAQPMFEQFLAKTSAAGRLEVHLALEVAWGAIVDRMGELLSQKDGDDRTLQIYAAGRDGMTPPDAVDWMGRRLLGEKCSSGAIRWFRNWGHDGLLCGGGPIRHPVLLEEILNDFFGVR
uniref:Uncharacterized protein n=1 Tax=Noctiluca scintillans TaxID=2966 RepID=A0A7S1AG85_NOCSC|mmetsp:Transcript_45083/g.119646  ORF Transcript_45083/g.119646 Transcript_45083/m.119646 type:complete len:400 (+) Transcript_45083:67-1266(+)